MAERAVAALQSCFGALPADTVPAVVDCVLASSLETSPSQLFSVLLDPSKVCFLLLGCLLNAKSPSKKKRKKKKENQCSIDNFLSCQEQQQDLHAAISHAAALCHLLFRFGRNLPPSRRAYLFLF
jgi:tRNA guanosine-2'-O-methyltransferase